MLNVIRKVEGVNNNFGQTKHYGERTNRNKSGEKTIEHIFEVERQGRLQLHIILSDATVVVVDKEKNVMVTMLNARPAQIKRYYAPLGLVAPKHLLDEATINNIKSYNEL